MGIYKEHIIINHVYLKTYVRTLENIEQNY